MEKDEGGQNYLRKAIGLVAMAFLIFLQGLTGIVTIMLALEVPGIQGFITAAFSLVCVVATVWADFLIIKSLLMGSSPKGRWALAAFLPFLAVAVVFLVVASYGL